jgi:hypothetical protein
VDLGLKRVEMAIQSMDQRERMGRKGMGLIRPTEAGGWVQPKKKKFKISPRPSRVCWDPNPIRS